MECKNCIIAPPPYCSAIVPYLFQFPADFLIRQLKYNATREMARAGGGLLAAAIAVRYQARGTFPDVILPVPLSEERLRERGFNQSYALAQWCGSVGGLEVADDLIWRTRKTSLQSGLDREARLDNLHGAFAACDSVYGRHILIMDDVMTTGATFTQAARCLIEAGAAEVDVCAFARTAEPGKSLDDQID